MADTKKSSFPKFKHVQVRTPTAVARFPKVHTPDAPYKPGDKPKFKITLIFDGDADLSAITNGSLAVAKEVYPSRAANKVNVLIKDGDEYNSLRTDDGKEIVEEFKGKVFINANSNVSHPPQVVGPDRQPLTGGVEVRGGDIVKAILAPIPSETPTKGSIAFRLLAVQLIEKRSGGGDYTGLFDEEGEGFGGRADGTPSSGVDAGEGADDNDLPF
jgi:hypothetical protein